MEKFTGGDVEKREISEAEKTVIGFLEQAESELKAGSEKRWEKAMELVEKARAIFEINRAGLSMEVCDWLDKINEQIISHIEGSGGAERRIWPEMDFAVSSSPDENKSSNDAFLKQCERFELEARISDFGLEDQALVKKYISGEKRTKEEANRVKKMTNDWWVKQKVGGNPCDNLESRREYLESRYGSESEARKLRARFVNNFAGDSANLKNLHQEYVEKYPGQIEGIEALFGFKDFLAEQKKLDEMIQKNHGWTEQSLEICQRLTEYRYLMTDFVINNSGNRNFLENFWQMMGDAAKQSGNYKEFGGLQRSTISQVSVFHAFKKLGMEPKLSHPKEDAFKAIDIWVGPDEVAQIMGTDDEMIVDYIAFPGVEAQRGDEISHIADCQTARSNKLMAKTEQFIRKASAYGKYLGKKNLKGYIIAMPLRRDMVDPVNGEPSEKYMDFFESRLSANK